MKKNKNLASALIEDYAGQGFGEKVDEFTLRAHDGSGVLELDSIEDEATGEVVGIEVFNEGFSTAELRYDDEDFNKKLLAQVASILNV
jgi:hypothetical protein